MERIDILIPTRNRLGKLERCLSTIPGRAFGAKIYTHILCDGDEKTYNHFKNDPYYICKYFPGHNGSVKLRNLEAKDCEDAILYAVDDMEFFPGALEQAVDEFKEKFPDDDGVLGFTQIGQNTFNPAGVALMGKQFVNRYPDKQIFYPEYFLFACQEIHWLAEKLKRFYLSPNAKIMHYHPSFHKTEMDQTHKDGRIHTKKDHALITERKSKGLIWGDNEKDER
jgi:glycosyltransferase involved in cell wall biosynthesis